ncbi:unnamed protein product [Toxocara canis]|uniref:Beta-hexosaminidase n=1 Tax=Toxocara canis TaxID=6265 RepID=A0A183UHE4_TOXCA|nr:unnamed protein product [Toxocara canis]
MPRAVLIFCFLYLASHCKCAWPDPYVKTHGEIWPLPQQIERKETVWSFDPKKFAIRSASKCDIIVEAIKRYTARLLTMRGYEHQPDISFQDPLSSLEVVVEGECPQGVPQLGMDESYKLNVTSSDAVLRAAEVWGALRGLESFSHLVYYNASQGHMIRSTIIKDFPRFPHRGVLLDTSRHFLSVNAIKANIELMSQNKFNVFHWHIVDNEAFPYASEAIPSLSDGAYTCNHKYSLEQIKDIVAYARLRGVRVVAEFDTPGHMQSWGKGMQSLLTRCFDSEGRETFDRSLIDPTNEDTWDEVFAVFPENYVHLGGDETEFWIPDCWEHNKNITTFMSLYGLKSARDLEQWYFSKLINMLNAPHREIRKRFIVWQEVLDMDIELANAIAHVWKGGSTAEQMQEMADVTSKGHYALLSACWYLDYIHTAADWFDYYKCDPQEFNGSSTQKNLVLGGEATLWGEWVDESNVISRLWPRASAVAERLWSDKEQTKDPSKAWHRLYEMQCRMASRGYPVQPAYGPGFCDFEYHAALPV